jgi:hypothetical protein
MMVAGLAAEASGLGTMVRWQAGSTVGVRSGGRTPTIARIAGARRVPVQRGRGLRDGG